MAGIVLDGVSREFPAAGVVLRQLSLRIGSGELFVLVGPSGSGKTTLLRLLAGLERPTAGRLELAGQNVTDVPAHRRGVAMVFQQEALFPHLTVRENLAFGRTGRQARGESVESRLAEVARPLRIEALLDRRCEQLSGGERRRVAIGRALVARPQTLLLDEPLANLDVSLRDDLMAELVGVHRRLGCTTVWVTHDPTEALTVADRLGVLIAGELQQTGRPREVYDHPASVPVAESLGRPPINLIRGALEHSDAGLRFVGRDGWSFFTVAQEFQSNPAVQRLAAWVEEWATNPTPQHTKREVICGVRPEWLTLLSGSKVGLHAAAAEVAAVSWADGAAVAMIRPRGKPDGLHVRVRTASGAVSTGDAAAVELNWSAAQWFDPHTGQNLSSTTND